MKSAENELTLIQDLIYKTYFNCFKKETQIPTISILENIENALEEEFQRVSELDPDYVQEAQAKKDKQHREEERIMKQRKQHEDQQKKLEHALARANKNQKRQRKY